ncbi:hypothetical protein A2J03_13470 [Rhodococcus sp. EPR-157]|jgi:hypothetical protein|uniref:hypothetical protein n=1 Tax=Rhodococcus sp. EPR-157 TaxID=1813677 RepID=UPI0007BBDBD3|nr:hypothetical protein [Rhodococcus sp. EPR-157]KZE98628.1 hypothetical protein A2J03_13470 [Rhodococcus sp. EPR-157]
MDDTVRRRHTIWTTTLSTVAITVLAACGAAEDTPDEAPLADLEPRVVAPQPLNGSPITDSTVLSARMLLVADVPDGFAVIPDPVRDLGLDPAPDYDAQDRSGTDPQSCADVLATVAQQSPGASADAEVRYSGPEFSSIDEDAASYADSGAAAAFDEVQNAFAQCTEYTGTDADGVGVKYRLGAREQETIGDASTSVRLETTSEGYTLVADAVVAVVDHTVVQLVVTSQEGVDPASFTALAKTAADRIRGNDAGV